MNGRRAHVASHVDRRGELLAEHRPAGLLVMSAGLDRLLFTAAQRARLESLVDLRRHEPVTNLLAVPEALLTDIEVLVTCWGAPRLDEPELARMPRLRAVLHAAGSVHGMMGTALIERPDIVVTTAAQANAVPVAEFALAQILLAGKRHLHQAHAHRVHRGVEDAWRPDVNAGNYGAVVGLIGASRIGRLVAQMLRPFDLEVLIADPYAEEAEMRTLGAQKVELPDLFARSDVVSLHAPDVPSTQRMITSALLGSMRDGSTFINTARSALVDVEALRRELVSGRISAVLDVHDDLAPEDPLWDIDTVEITPHIAGSQGNELHRLAASVLKEIELFASGLPPSDPVDRELLQITA